MNRPHHPLLLAVLALCCGLSEAADSIPLWPGKPPRFMENAPAEVTEARGTIRNVSVPALTLFLPPADKRTGMAVIVCAGGGYGALDWKTHVIYAADVFNPMGVAVIGLKYRLRPPHKLDNAGIQALTLLDAKRVMRLVRHRAAGWGIDPHKIGVAGYSAGADLAMNLAANFDAGDPMASDLIERESSRPDFAVGLATWHWRQKESPFTFRKDSPPVFLVHATNDGINGGAPIELPRAIKAGLEKLGVPVRMLEFDEGAHGVGNLIPQRVKNGFPPAKWPELLMQWLEKAPAPGADLTHYTAACGVEVKSEDGQIRVTWPTDGKRQGEIQIDLREDRPLIASLNGILKGLSPLLTITAGTRVSPEGRPPGMSIWNTFFDNPHKRPHQTHRGVLTKKRATVTSEGRRATIAIGELVAGPFSGEVCFTFFADCALVKMEAVVSTQEDKTAYVFDLGLVGQDAGWKNLSWTDTEGKRQTRELDEGAQDEALAVRNRLLAIEGERGSLAIFPPPHQFFYPLDWTTNTKNIWIGANHQGEGRFGFGVRHDPRGAGNFVPWFNAPPGTKQRLGLFLLINHGGTNAALNAALRYTRGDRFAPLAGMTTFTTHYHMAVAMTAMEQMKKGVNPLPVPEFVKVFKDMGVQALHLGEFHGDGHQDDPGPLRLPEMQMMFSECARLSDDSLLLIPGEEINTHLGIPFPGRHPGHWMLLFPRPVFWTKVRTEGQPLIEQHPQFGTVYHAGNREDMVGLIKREHALAWTAHPRIKASNWTPDIFKNEDFYKDDLWLGAAFKSMPADLSRERLGERCLDLLDDMANWGQKKYLPGEVDVFKIDHTHELYGHMNINYLRLPRMPRYADGWQPVLDVLRRGAFFTTTGEVLIQSFTVGGKQSGEVLKLPADGKAEVRVELAWTFPMKFAEIISGDGAKVYRERIELSDTGAFGSQALSLTPDLRNRRWVRFEAWDSAVNGAYSQPVWLE